MSGRGGRKFATVWKGKGSGYSRFVVRSGATQLTTRLSVRRTAGLADLQHFGGVPRALCRVVETAVSHRSFRQGGMQEGAGRVIFTTEHTTERPKRETKKNSKKAYEWTIVTQEFPHREGCTSHRPTIRAASHTANITHIVFEETRGRGGFTPFRIDRRGVPVFSSHLPVGNVRGCGTSVERGVRSLRPAAQPKHVHKTQNGIVSKAHTLPMFVESTFERNSQYCEALCCCT